MDGEGALMATRAIERNVSLRASAKGFKVSLSRRVMTAFAWMFVVFSFLFVAAMFVSIIGDV
ncbi:MAG: hypothetical protein ACYCUY_10010, partial [Acidithiobacillus sp.]